MVSGSTYQIFHFQAEELGGKGYVAHSFKGLYGEPLVQQHSVVVQFTEY